MNVNVALDVFFMILHPCIILFNTLGWIWKRTRIYNLLLLLLTAFSWFILGIWKGWGYCFLTDLHYRALEKLGYHNLPNSYIRFLILRITGLDIRDDVVDAVTTIVFFAALALSIALNVRDSKRRLYARK